MDWVRLETYRLLYKNPRQKLSFLEGQTTTYKLTQKFIFFVSNCRQALFLSYFIINDDEGVGKTDFKIVLSIILI